MSYDMVKVTYQWKNTFFPDTARLGSMLTVHFIHSGQLARQAGSVNSTLVSVDRAG